MCRSGENNQSLQLYTAQSHIYTVTTPSPGQFDPGIGLCSDPKFPPHIPVPSRRTAGGQLLAKGRRIPALSPRGRDNPDEFKGKTKKALGRCRCVPAAKRRVCRPGNPSRLLLQGSGKTAVSSRRSGCPRCRAVARPFPPTQPRLGWTGSGRRRFPWQSGLSPRWRG